MSSVSEAPTFAIDCASSVSMYDITDSRPFACGNQNRAVAWNGSDEIRFTSTGTSEVPLSAELDFPGETAPHTILFEVEPIEPLAQAENLTASVNTSTYGFTVVELSWTGERFGTTPGRDVYAYNVYRNTTANFTPGETNEIGGGNQFSFTDTNVGVHPGTYYYVVQARDRGDNLGPASAPAMVVVH
jgi:hypothetical protein